MVAYISGVGRKDREMTTPVFAAALEAELVGLYTTTAAVMTEAALAYRTELANLYYAATGRWFAARFYY
jgi:hypothetical protein